MSFVPKVSETLIFLGKITKITPISLNYDTPILWFFFRSVDPLLIRPPLQLSTEEYLVWIADLCKAEFIKKCQQLLKPLQMIMIRND